MQTDAQNSINAEAQAPRPRRRHLRAAISLILCLLFTLEWQRSRTATDTLMLVDGDAAAHTLAFTDGRLILSLRTLRVDPALRWRLMWASLVHDHTEPFVLDPGTIQGGWGDSTHHGWGDFSITTEGTTGPFSTQDAGYVVVTSPIWLFILLFAILPATSFRSWLRSRRRSRRGLCLNCGYDLRASHGQCPECGQTISDKPAPIPRNKQRIAVLASALAIGILVGFVLRPRMDKPPSVALPFDADSALLDRTVATVDFKNLSIPDAIISLSHQIALPVIMQADDADRPWKDAHLSFHLESTTVEKAMEAFITALKRGEETNITWDIDDGMILIHGDSSAPTTDRMYSMADLLPRSPGDVARFNQLIKAFDPTADEVPAQTRWEQLTALSEVIQQKVGIRDGKDEPVYNECLLLSHTVRGHRWIKSVLADLRSESAKLARE